jgi:alpha-galactosidase
MKSITTSLFAASAIQSIVLAAPAGQDDPLAKRLENGLGRTPALGYNNWVSNTVIESDVMKIIADHTC